MTALGAYYSPGLWHNPDPSPPSPSRREGEDFFAWLDRMHANPPPGAAGEVYANEGVTTEVVSVDGRTVRWRSTDGSVRESYRVTFEEWAADGVTVRP